MREADCVKRAVLPERLLANAGPCMLTLQNTAGLRCCIGVCECACVSHCAGRSGSVTVKGLSGFQCACVLHVMCLGFVRSLTTDGQGGSFLLPCSC